MYLYYFVCIILNFYNFVIEFIIFNDYALRIIAIHISINQQKYTHLCPVIV